MATTWMKALHRGGGSIAAALGLRLDYAKDFSRSRSSCFPRKPTRSAPGATKAGVM